ncbi:MAG: flagellar basal-body rod protein FlgF, partial [Pseudomonadota bacterium]
QMRSLDIGATGMLAQQLNVEVISNNIANMNTAGFKSESVLFSEYLSEIEGDAAKLGDLSFVLDRGVARDMTEGSLENTSSALDMAIFGDGFFTVETERGERYTRNGHFGTDDLGRLTTRDGDAVLDENGQEIILDLAEEITVSEDGVISTSAGEVARLGLVRFEKPELLTKEGGALYASEDEPVEVEEVRIKQGMLESSNVAPILEMTKMIDISRAYQSASKMIETASELTRKAVDKLGQQK